MKRSSPLFLALSLLLGFQLQLQAQSFAAFDSYLSKEVQEGRLVGVHGMIFQDGKIAYDQTYGLRDRESTDPLRGD